MGSRVYFFRLAEQFIPQNHIDVILLLVTIAVFAVALNSILKLILMNSWQNLHIQDKIVEFKETSPNVEVVKTIFVH